MLPIINFIKKYKIIIITTLLSTFVVFGSVFMFVNINENKLYKGAEKQIIDLSQNIIKSYQLKPDYWGLSTDEVISKKLYTNNMRVQNGKLIGYFDKTVEIGADDNGNIVMPTKKNFVIAYKNLTKKQCFGILSQKFNKTFWLNINKITIKNNTISQDFVWGNTSFSLPVSKKNLKNMCIADKNVIVMQF